jgi:putative tryptophan/tyrosine transport system substrate-binding protein
MNRRKFIALVSGAAASLPAARAQQSERPPGALPIVGLLGSVSTNSDRLAEFRRGLSEQGYVEGRNVRIEYRSADGQYDRLPAQAAELVSLPVNVIAAVGSSPSAKAAKGATSRIPIVFYLGVDPVEMGLVASFNSPGGNITGVCAWQASMTPKLFEMLDELVPKPALLAFLINPNNPFAGKDAKVAQLSAKDIGRDLVVLGAGTEAEIDATFEGLAQQRVRGLIVDQEAFLSARSHQIASLGLRYKIPALHAEVTFAEAGGLISYSANALELYRQVGIYVGKILKGASPAQLPVLQPTKYELVINLKTAKLLDLTIPPALLATADKVIE